MPPLIIYKINSDIRISFIKLLSCPQATHTCWLFCKYIYNPTYRPVTT